MPQVLVFLGLIGFGIALFALIRGHLDWARIRNRKIATAGVVVTFGMMITGSALATPAPATNTAATSATAGNSAPTESTTLALPTTTTTVPPTTTTTTEPPTTTTTTTTTNPTTTTTTITTTTTLVTHRATTTVPRTPTTRRTTTPPPPAGPPVTCSATVSNPNPTDGSTIFVIVSTGAPGATVTAAAQYKSKTTERSGVAGGNGVASIPFDIGGATPNRKVPVTVNVSTGASCSTSFTPQQ